VIVPRNATNLITHARLVDASNSAVTGVAYNGTITVSYRRLSDSSWQSVTLVEGTLGTFIENSWKEIDDGNYQFCPPNSAIVEGTSTLVRIVADGNPAIYGFINATGAINLDSNFNDITEQLSQELTDTFLYDQIISGVSVANPSAVVDKDDDRVIHFAYRRIGSGLFHVTYNLDTKTVSSESTILPPQGVDPKLRYVNGELWCIYSTNLVGTLQLKKSPDNGATWGAAIPVASGTKFEDVDWIEAPNGHIVVISEDEIVDKGESRIVKAISTDNGVSFTQSTLIAGNGTTDYEGPALALDGTDIILVIAAVDTATGISYEENVIKLMRSTDNGATFESYNSVNALLDQRSHVEYDICKLGGKWYLHTARGFEKNDAICWAGYVDLGTTLSPTRIGQNGWNQQAGSVVVGEDFAELTCESNERGYFTRPMCNESLVDFCILNAQVRGTSVFDYRISFCHQSVDSIEDHYLVIIKDTTAELYKGGPVGGFTKIGPTGTIQSMSLNTEYDFRLTWDNLSGNVQLYIDDLTTPVWSQADDNTYNTSKAVGISCGSDPTNPATKQPIRFGKMTLKNEWVEDWSCYPTFYPLTETRGTIQFCGPIFSTGSETYVVLENRDEDRLEIFRANNIAGCSSVNEEDIYNYFTSGSNEDAFKADVSTLATSAALASTDADVTAIKTKTDQLTFTISNQVDANSLTGGGDDAATIYTYFTSSSRANAFKATGFSTHSVADIWNESQAGYTTVGTFGYYLDYLISAAGGSGLTVQAIVDGVWNEDIADHLNAGSTGLALNNAGVAGDPMSAVVPGAYAPGTAGYVLGTNLDQPVSDCCGDDPGKVAYTVTITYNDIAVSSVETHVTTDITGINKVSPTLYTNDFGKVTFRLDPGTFYLWREHPSYCFENPVEFTVEDDNAGE
jgi:hypothetical protein